MVPLEIWAPQLVQNAIFIPPKSPGKHVSESRKMGVAANYQKMRVEAIAKYGGALQGLGVLFGKCAQPGNGEHLALRGFHHQYDPRQ